MKLVSAAVISYVMFDNKGIQSQNNFNCIQISGIL